MQVFLVHADEKLRELIAFAITSRFKVAVKELADIPQAIDALKKADAKRRAFEILAEADGKDKALKSLKEDSLVEVVIAPQDEALVKLMASLAVPLPTIFYSEEKPGVEPKGVEVLGFALNKRLQEDVFKHLEGFFKDSGTPGASDDLYCPIRTKLLIRTAPLHSDIFIRLSMEKYLCLFAKGADFGPEDVKKYYEQKKIEYMYIRKEDTGAFAERLQQDLDTLLNDKTATVDQLDTAVELTQESIQEMVAKVGFDESVQELAKKNMELTLKSVSKSPKLSELIARCKSGGNYLANHCTLLAHVSCCIAEELDWTSDNTFAKLVLAALLHDVMIRDPQLAKITTLHELETKKSQFAPEAVKSYVMHPVNAAAVVKTFKEIPPDVDVIIIQHHERPNGGFPRGLAHNYVSPLSAVFIIAHDLVQFILEDPQNFAMEKFIEDKKRFFSQGNFKKIMVSLDKIKLS